MNKMEDYFKSEGCEYVLVDVFAYNENAIKFYDRHGYHSRMYTNIKKIKWFLWCRLLEIYIFMKNVKKVLIFFEISNILILIYFGGVIWIARIII